MSKNSRAKGKRGELELAELFREFGFHARRSQQYRGTADSQDLAHHLYGFHVECKRTESLRLYQAMEQATKDCGNLSGNIPLVFHKANRKPWVVILDASDFLSMMRLYLRLTGENAKQSEAA